MKTRLLSCLLAVMTVLCLILGSCTASQTEKAPQTTDAPGTEVPKPRNELKELLLSGEYRVVRPDTAPDTINKLMSSLKNGIEAKLGTALSLENDWVRKGDDPDAVYPCEILLGKTNRTALATEIDALGLLEYLIAASGTKIVVAGGSEYALSLAVGRLPELLDAEEVTLPVRYDGAAEGGNGPVDLKIGTYNIKDGQMVGFDFSVLAADILKAGLDVCGLQEIDQNTARNGGRDTMKLLSKASGYPYFAFAKAIDYQGGEYGTGILSKHPIISFETVLLESDGNEQRAFGHAVLLVNGTLVDFYNTHLSYEDPKTRGKQFAQLAETVAGKTRWAMTADFNTEIFSEFDCFADAQLVNNEENKMLSSCGKSTYGKSAIDNIVLPAAATVRESGCFNQVNHSDHFMVWAEVTLP